MDENASSPSDWIRQFLHQQLFQNVHIFTSSRRLKLLVSSGFNNSNFL